MTRQLIKHDVLRWLSAAFAVLLTAAMAAAAPEGERGDAAAFAMVPRAIIYPGDVITAEQVTRVEVTNPNLSGNYAQDPKQVVGMVTKRTLLPDHAIYVNDLREPFAVSRGTQIRMIYDAGKLQITALGVPLEDGSIGDLIRVRNADSGLTVSGTVVASGMVRVLQK